MTTPSLEALVPDRLPVREALGLSSAAKAQLMADMASGHTLSFSVYVPPSPDAEHILIRTTPDSEATLLLDMQQQAVANGFEAEEASVERDNPLTAQREVQQVMCGSQ